VFLIAIRALWTESVHVILTNFLQVVIKLTQVTKPAEASFIVRAVFCSLVDRIDMSIYALVTFLTLSILDKVLARWDLVFLIDVQILTVITLLTLFVQPMHTNSTFPLALINLLVLSLEYRSDLVYTKLVLSCH
jgi:hypothetical protein